MKNGKCMQVLIFSMVALLCFSALSFAESLNSKVNLSPKVSSVTPRGEALLPPARYPEFINISGGYDWCRLSIRNSSYALKNADNVFSPIVNNRGGGDPLEVSVPLTKENSNGSILIVWTLRVEGFDPSAISCPDLCEGDWHTSFDQIFKGGVVQSQAYISYDGHTYSPLGNPSSMTLPDGGMASYASPRDPTHSGSYALKIADLGITSFPKTIKIKIY